MTNDHHKTECLIIRSGVSSIDTPPSSSQQQQQQQQQRRRIGRQQRRQQDDEHHHQLIQQKHHHHQRKMLLLFVLFLLSFLCYFQFYQNNQVLQQFLLTFSKMRLPSSSSSTTTTTTAASIITTTTNTTNTTTTSNNKKTTEQKLALLLLQQQQPQQQQQQQRDEQYLPRRNMSRSFICGSIPLASAPAVHVPEILSSSSSSSSSSFSSSSSSSTNVLLSMEEEKKKKEAEKDYNSCRSNAIVYLVQKGKHSTYERNSTALFLKSLDLLYKNYLSIDQHYDNVDVLLFHTGDFTRDDLNVLHARYHQHVHFQLINLNNTDYWTLPLHLQQDNRSNWTRYPQFNMGYRHMMRWYALKLYDFIRDYNHAGTTSCSYQYIMRLDEDSYIHSTIDYDLFDFMQSNNYSYGFRMCSYELETQVWEDYEDYLQHCNGNDDSGGGAGGGGGGGDGMTINNNNNNSNMTATTTTMIHPYRRVTQFLCGFYSNFFILNVDVMLQPHVQHFLQWIDRLGIIYRDRYGDLNIQALVIYAFVPPHQIHRFLDFTYEHMTVSGRCPIWGSIQAGYRDLHWKSVFTQYTAESNYWTNTNNTNSSNSNNSNSSNSSISSSSRCPIRQQSFVEKHMSPTYAHLPSPQSSWWKVTLGTPRYRYRWRTFATGKVEMPNRGIDSG